MRLLADENFPRSVIEALRGDHDLLWAKTHCPGLKDTALIDLAESQGRIVLTLDRDFWQIALQRRVPLEQSGVVLFRVHPATPAHVACLSANTRRETATPRVRATSIRTPTRREDAAGVPSVVPPRTIGRPAGPRTRRSKRTPAPEQLQASYSSTRLNATCAALTGC